MEALTDEQRMVLKTVRELAEQNFAEKACTWNDQAPWENIQLLAEHGFLGLNFDEKYGGGGMTEIEAVLMIEIVSRVCPDTGLFLNSQQMLAPRAVNEFGTESAKKAYLPPIMNGEDAMALAISEPDAGSDVSAMNTTAVEDGDGFRVTGEKTWVSDVPHSSSAVVWVRYPNEGLGSLIVDFDAEGVDIANHFTNMAGHKQTQFYMEDVYVPKENVLTHGRSAFKEQLVSLNWERLGNAAMITGRMAFALDMAIEYATEREQFGQPIGDFQGIEWKLADLVKQYKAAQGLTHQAARNAVSADRTLNRLDASVATLYASEVAERVVSECLQIHGANAYQRGHPLEFLYRDVRGWRIGAGTDEIQKNQIADAIKENGLGHIV
ncbi:acyl-CoA dehydrogenase family protein [Halobacterium sp. KA-6]|jgi:alkylation response protein AidB-like acyl-CoA dehydrogenase|uniref:acyl-CoA dehydrogenase family protein n=1 Tax=Halobacterium sp. KA-6 TaxID=2896368 RepID=UPI001E351442|nr:acyl-CoA dehydrogenase family protein [Halobacterium sp. KA-6]MCD2203378.1 acyl-CoA dehydrogenase family protein [Halobacterium sp. KA-6]